jgi:hypothetical protein
MTMFAHCLEELIEYIYENKPKQLRARRRRTPDVT